MRYQFTVKSEDEGRKAVDILIHRHGFSRYATKKIRLYGHLLVNELPTRMLDPLCSGDQVDVLYDCAGELPWGSTIAAQKDIPIYFQDEWLLVVGKPPSLLTHPSFLGERESLISRLSDYTLHPITRLDKDTSGLIILAKSGHAHYLMSRTNIEKEYIGYTYGVMPEQERIIDAPIARKESSLIERRVAAEGKASQTICSKLAVYAGMAQKLSFRLLTGRTHQIRVHCRHIGCAMIGDSLYRPFEADREIWQDKDADIWQKLEQCSATIGRQALHASHLRFQHPITQESIDITARPTEDLIQLEARLEAMGLT